MVNWYCGRCELKLKKELDAEPSVLIECTGCGIENFCKGEVGESIPVLDAEQETKEVAEQFPELVNEDEVQSEEEDAPMAIMLDSVTADVPLEPVILEPENETQTLEEQIAALRAKIDAYEAEKE